MIRSVVEQRVFQAISEIIGKEFIKELRTFQLKKKIQKQFPL